MLKRTLKKFLKRLRMCYYDRCVHRLRPRELTSFFESLGLQSGMVVFVHSSFGELGYFPPGPIGFVQSLCDLVGGEGIIAMPAFPFDGSMQDFVEANPVFDVNSSPSMS